MRAGCVRAVQSYSCLQAGNRGTGRHAQIGGGGGTRCELVDGDRTERRLEARVVRVLALVQPLGEDCIDHAAALIVNEAAHLERFEDERALLREDLLATLVARRARVHHHLARPVRARQAAIGWVGEEITLGELLGHRPLKVGEVELNTRNLWIVERLHAQRVFEHQS